MASKPINPPASNPIDTLLQAPWLYYAGTVLLTFIFWSSGLAKLLGFGQALEEMQQFGLEPAAVYAVATIIVQLGGSLLVIFSKRYAWLGAGALAVFTLLTIPIAHRFWEMEGPAAFLEQMFVFEHITVIGGLILVSILAYKRQQS